MPESVTRFRDTLQGQLGDMLSLLETLVNIDSGSYCKAGVNEVGRIFAHELERTGFDVQRRPMAACGDQIVATLRLKGKRRLLVLGHMDTVWPEGTAREWPFAIRGDRATGPGVGDMKASVVMAIFALRALLAHGFHNLASIEFFLVPDEEIGSIHSRADIEAAARNADIALVLEPTRPGGGIVTARGTVGTFFISAKGQSAHCATNYAKGASAVRELALKVPLLERLSKPEQRTIVNVGIFRGGAARQVVPSDARIDIDVRAPTLEQAESVVSAMRAIAANRVDPRIEIEMTGQITRPGYASKRNRPLYDVAASLAAELAIPVFEVPPTGGGSDANFAAGQNVPTLDGLGPVCHDICSREETIEIDSLVTRGALFCGLVQALGSIPL